MPSSMHLAPIARRRFLQFNGQQLVLPSAEGGEMGTDDNSLRLGLLHQVRKVNVQIEKYGSLVAASMKLMLQWTLPNDSTK